MKFRINHRQAGKKIENQLVMIDENGVETIVDTCKGKARHQVVVKKFSNEGMIKFWENQIKSTQESGWDAERIEKYLKEYRQKLIYWKKKKDQEIVDYFGATWSNNAGQKVDLREWDTRHDFVAIVTL